MGLKRGRYVFRRGENLSEVYEKMCPRGIFAFSVGDRVRSTISRKRWCCELSVVERVDHVSKWLEFVREFERKRCSRECK